MSRRKKKKGGCGSCLVTAILLLVLILGGAAMIGYMLFTGNGVNSNPVTQSINREVTKKAVDTVIQKELGEDTSLDKIKEQMSDEDQEDLDQVINKYADEGLISEAVNLYQANGGDIMATARELRDKVSAEDMQKLEELYKKYSTGVLTGD